jgi:eukaryotic-like serine/threonine-protein kinase
MEATVESLCDALAASRLLTPEAVRDLKQRWQREKKGAAADAGAFARWLVSRDVATRFQLGVLTAGRGDQLFLGKYKLTDRIGRGVVAGVFKAVHSLGEVVAIKVLPPSKTSQPKTFARFQREARLAQRLNHANVVRTFQLAVDEGVYYLVMEYLVGETLADVLKRRGHLPPDETVYVVHQALLGLQHIHEQGLVHRDLSPENLMLVDGKPDDTRPATVKILDIGTGRALLNDGEGDGNYALTVAGDQLGTPEYRAPEQAADAHGVDIRADLYSIGCILFHALAGEPPFVDKNPVRLMLRHVSEPPRSLLAVCPDAPPGLQGVLDRLLAKKPAQRYADPAEVLKALAPFLPNVARNAAGRERPELKAFLRWLQAETVEVDLPPTPGPSAIPTKNQARRDLLADLANSTADVNLPDWLSREELGSAAHGRQSAGNDLGIDLSVGKPSAGKELKALLAGRSGPGMRNLLIAGLAVGIFVVLLLIIVIVQLLGR